MDVDGVAFVVLVWAPLEVALLVWNVRNALAMRRWAAAGIRAVLLSFVTASKGFLFVLVYQHDRCGWGSDCMNPVDPWLRIGAIEYGAVSLVSLCCSIVLCICALRR
jgi:hypothetical protein